MDILKCHSAFTLFRVKQLEVLYQEEENIHVVKKLHVIVVEGVYWQSLLIEC
jgi:hypothetical protein